jgi:hypothetical protein
MAFKRYRGATKTAWLPVTTSTAINAGSIVAWSSGLLIAATATSAANTHVGVLKKTIAATDADYAVARLVPVEIPVGRMERSCNIWISSYRYWFMGRSYRCTYYQSSSFNL